MKWYVVIDLEMCNVSAERRPAWACCSHEIIQIGAVLLNESLEICDTFSTYVKPQYGVIDPMIQKLTGITCVDVYNAPNCKEALTMLMKWVPENAVMVSWSGSDSAQIRKETLAKNICIPKLERLLETWIDCQETFGEIMFASRRYGLVEALNMSSIEYDKNIHNALVDAKNTAFLFAKMEREKDSGYRLSPYIVVRSKESTGFTPFAELLKCYV